MLTRLLLLFLTSNTKIISTYQLPLKQHFEWIISSKPQCLSFSCLSELESLAIAPKRLNELNDAYEMEQIVDNIKLNLYQEYKSN